MKPNMRRTVSDLAVGTLLFAWFGVALLWFCVPRLAAHGAQTGSELSAAAKMLLQLGNLVDRSSLAMGLLFIATVAAVAWRVAAIRNARRVKTE